MPEAAIQANRARDGNLGPVLIQRLDPHSHIALTLQSSTILTFPQSTRTLALALIATLTRHEISRFKTDEQEKVSIKLEDEAIVMRWQSHR